MAFALSTVCAWDRDRFVGELGGIYEKSPWVAESVFGSSFSSVTALATAMRLAVDASSEKEKVALLEAHPDLAGKAALQGEVTEESQSEQRRAGLDSLSPEELLEFNRSNDAYQKKFGWPFILAVGCYFGLAYNSSQVRNARKGAILKAFGRRLKNDAGVELAECLAQVHKIAWLRLLDKVHFEATGSLTCHVLDTANGRPAASMAITLECPDGQTRHFLTNEDGRLPNGPAICGHDFRSGTYQWLFYVNDYFTANGTPISPTPFLDVVPLSFGVDNPEQHYHVPLLCSPWAFSTYRGPRKLSDILGRDIRTYIMR